MLKEFEDKKSLFDEFLGPHKALVMNLCLHTADASGISCKMHNYYRQYRDGFTKEVSYVMEKITGASALFWQDPERYNHKGKKRPEKKKSV